MCTGNSFCPVAQLCVCSAKAQQADPAAVLHTQCSLLGAECEDSAVTHSHSSSALSPAWGRKITAALGAQLCFPR